MNILDDEVFAVLLAIVVVGSVFAMAQIVRPEIVEPFTAIGLLNEECRIGDYPKEVLEGQNLTLCIFLYNHMGYPLLMQVRYKIGTNETLPTNTTPSPRPVIKEYEVLLNNNENTTTLVQVPITVSQEYVGKRVALIFELWVYDTSKHQWVYTGEWNHLYVKVLEAPIP